MGHHELPRGECDHPADLRVDRGENGAAELFFAVDRGVHDRVDAVRNGDEPEYADRLARVTGAGGRRIATIEPGGAAGYFSAGETGGGNDDVQRRSAARAGGGADA